MRPAFASLLRNFIKFRAVVESKPVVGSSKKISDGLIKSSTPTDVRFFSPPERPRIKLFPTKVSDAFLSPNESIILYTKASFYSLVLKGNLISVIKRKVSLGVKVGNIRSSCMT